VCTGSLPQVFPLLCLQRWVGILGAASCSCSCFCSPSLQANHTLLQLLTTWLCFLPPPPRCTHNTQDLSPEYSRYCACDAGWGSWGCQLQLLSLPLNTAEPVTATIPPGKWGYWEVNLPAWQGPAQGSNDVAAAARGGGGSSGSNEQLLLMAERMPGPGAGGNPLLFLKPFDNKVSWAWCSPGCAGSGTERHGRGGDSGEEGGWGGQVTTAGSPRCEGTTAPPATHQLPLVAAAAAVPCHAGLQGEGAVPPTRLSTAWWRKRGKPCTLFYMFVVVQDHSTLAWDVIPLDLLKLPTCTDSQSTARARHQQRLD
jgi:hypothetical protein